MDPSHAAVALGAYAAMFGVVHLLRMWRWFYLLKHLGDFPMSSVMRAGAVGFAAIILLPLRLGEFVRPYVLARDTGCSMSSALGTAVVERVVDGLFISLLLFLTLATYEGRQSTTFAMVLGWMSLAIFVGALSVLVLGMWRRALTLKLVEAIFARFSAGLASRVVGLLEAFLDGVQSLRHGRSLAAFLVLTLSYWVVNGLSIAFLASYGFGLDLGAWAGMTVLAILVVGIMIPTGPAMAGNYELFALEALALFIAPAQVKVEGVAFVASLHAVQFFVQTLPGVLLVWRRKDSVMGLRREAEAALTAQKPGRPGQSDFR